MINICDGGLVRATELKDPTGHPGWMQASKIVINVE